MSEAKKPAVALVTPALPSKLTFKSLKDCANLEEAFQSREFIERIDAAAPEHIKPGRLLQTFIGSVRKTPLLAQASVPSFIGACLTLSQTGFEANTSLQHAFLIPFKTKIYNPATKKRDKEVVEIQVIFGYQGLLDLSFRSGLVRAVHADVVWAADEFSFEYGSDAHLRHRPTGQHREGEMPTHAYMHAVLKDGQAFEVMPYADVLRIRDQSQAYKSALFFKSEAEGKGWRPPASYTEAPWVRFEHQMARKTAFRAGSKWLPRSVELASVVELDEAGERRSRIDFGRALQAPTIDGTVDYLGASLEAAQEDEGDTGVDPAAAYGVRTTPPAESKPAAPVEFKPPAEPKPKADPKVAAKPGADAKPAGSAPPPDSTPKPAAAPGVAPFEAILISAFGEVLGEPFDDRMAFARAAVEYWRTLPPADVGAYVEHNEASFDDARADLDAVQVLFEMTQASDGPPIETLHPGMDRGKPHWLGYIVALKAALVQVPPHKLVDWIDAQRSVLETVPLAQRAQAVKALTTTATALHVPLPAWVPALLTAKAAPAAAPAAAPESDSDEKWVTDTMAALADMTILEPLAEAQAQFKRFAAGDKVRAAMLRLRTDKPALFGRCDAQFASTAKGLREREIEEAHERRDE